MASLKVFQISQKKILKAILNVLKVSNSVLHSFTLNTVSDINKSLKGVKFLFSLTLPLPPTCTTLTQWVIKWIFHWFASMTNTFYIRTFFNITFAGHTWGRPEFPGHFAFRERSRNLSWNPWFSRIGGSLLYYDLHHHHQRVAFIIWSTSHTLT